MGIKSDIYRSALRDYDAIKSASGSSQTGNEKNKSLQRKPQTGRNRTGEMNAQGVAAAKNN